MAATVSLSEETMARRESFSALRALRVMRDCALHTVRAASSAHKVLSISFFISGQNLMPMDIPTAGAMA